MMDPLTPVEVAEILRVGKTVVYDLVNAGRLRHLRVGKRILIYRRDLDAFIEANMTGGVRA